MYLEKYFLKGKLIKLATNLTEKNDRKKRTNRLLFRGFLSPKGFKTLSNINFTMKLRMKAKI